MHCFDTDILSALIRPAPPPRLIRRLAFVPPDSQATTSISVGELLYGLAKRGSQGLAERVREVIEQTQLVIPFDRRAAEVYGPLRARLESEGRRLNDPDLFIAAIAMSRELTLVTGNIRHFARIPGLQVEDWLSS